MLIEEAIAGGWEIEAQFVDPKGRAVPGAGGHVFDLAPHVMQRVASTQTPQPVLAVVRMQGTSIAALAGASMVVVSDRVSDPGNMGTILRSAEAAGVDGIVLLSGSVDPFNPKVVRASAGSLFHVPLVEDVAMHELQGLGLPLVGTSSHQGAPYTDADLARPFALVLGNEAHGVDPQLPIDEWISIPHVGRAESLNVAMAATLVVFEAVRQRVGR